MELDHTQIDPTTYSNVTRWLESDIDAETRKAILDMTKNNIDELVNCFYTRLSFGTGGLRGVMGPGTNRINNYTVRAATLGLANYLKATISDEELRVFLSYDSRHHSHSFALEAARVLAANGIRAYITKDLRPTPMVSFGCRHFHCHAAIMITASHNPPEYNGYKVYWSDGGQVTSPHDKRIIEEVNKITDMSGIAVVDFPHPLITEVGPELDAIYLDTIDPLRTLREVSEKRGGELSVLFSALHGTGTTMVPQTLTRWGFSNVAQVSAQAQPDGSFPTVVSPNPEEREALSIGIEMLLREKSDLFLATDPDADRVGVVVRHNDAAVLLTGNQIACLCLEHLCQHLSLPENGIFAKTIVTTELFRKIAEDHGLSCDDTLPGFKYIAQKIQKWEETNTHLFLFGGEESYGYLLGDKVRDKDAVISCALLCEAALAAKIEGKTLIDRLEELYQKYGVHRETLLSVCFPETRQGRSAMEKAMKRLREHPPTTLDGQKVVCTEDYLTGRRHQLTDGSETTIALSQSNILVFWLENSSKAVVRPSGTEPKIKIYAGVTGKQIEECDMHAKTVLNELQGLLSENLHSN